LARLQAKLLRVAQDGEVRPVGETTTRHVDVRTITATNCILASEVAAGRFRQISCSGWRSSSCVSPRCGAGAATYSCWRSTSGREPWRRPVGTLRWAVTHLRRPSATTGQEFPRVRERDVDASGSGAPPCVGVGVDASGGAHGGRVGVRHDARRPASGIRAGVCTGGTSPGGRSAGIGSERAGDQSSGAGEVDDTP
jgi:hypothetical protein